VQLRQMQLRQVHKGTREVCTYHDNSDGEENPVTVVDPVSAIEHSYQPGINTHNNWGSLWIVCTGTCAILSLPTALRWLTCFYSVIWKRAVVCFVYFRSKLASCRRLDPLEPRAKHRGWWVGTPVGQCNLKKTCRSGQSERSCSSSNCAGGLSESEALSSVQTHRHLRLQPPGQPQ
jgi:hypothetical protein